MRIRLIALSVLAGIIVPASSAVAAGSGGIGIRLVDVPTDSPNDPLARSYIVDQLAPGTGIRRRVEIVNSTRTTADVAVYPAAAGLYQGNFWFAPGHSRNELSSWTSMSRNVVRLPPGTKAFETVTINVPADASSGARYAVIWAEVSTRAPAAGGVRLVNRVGIRMYLSIGPGGAARSSFVIGSVSAERSKTGAPLVVAIVHNTGGRALEINGELTLAKGPGGLRAGPFPVEPVSALAPDDSKSVTVQLDERLPLGPWHAHIRLRSGSILRTAIATIAFPAHVAAAEPRAAPATESSPLIVAVVVILFVLLAAIVLALFSRRLSQGRGGGVGPVAPLSGGTPVPKAN